MNREQYQEIAVDQNVCTADAPERPSDPWEEECAARGKARLEGVDEALKLVDCARLVHPSVHPAGRYETYRLLREAGIALAAEVRRLREENQKLLVGQQVIADAAFARQTKLARVEAALSQYRGYTLADKIAEALRDPQPSAATPKGEPYNGY